jgi:hypothetical protein
MRDLTVLRTVAAGLDGWSDLHARLEAEQWPSVLVGRWREGAGVELWACRPGHAWHGELFDHDPGAAGGFDRARPVATITTTIPEAASASEVVDGIKALYRRLRTSPVERAG